MLKSLCGGCWVFHKELQTPQDWDSSYNLSISVWFWRPLYVFSSVHGVQKSVAMEVAPEDMFCRRTCNEAVALANGNVCTPELSKITEATKFFLFL